MGHENLQDELYIHFLSQLKEKDEIPNWFY